MIFALQIGNEMRIAINGMGRIGRLLFRKLVNNPEIELVAVNDIMPVDNLAYLLKYDSVYGTFEKKGPNNKKKKDRIRKLIKPTLLSTSLYR